MIPDPIGLQNASGDASFSRTSLLGSKGIYLQTTGNASSTIQTTMTIAHEDNLKSGRRRSVLRFDTVDNPSEGEDVVTETAAVYLVIDRQIKDTLDPAAGAARRMVAQLLSFFTEDPTAAASGNLDYNIDSALANRLFNGEP